MKTKYPAYIILDIPEPIAASIISIRSKYDPFRAKLPAEITVFGSTGTRHIREEQEIPYLISEIDRIAPGINKVDFKFGGFKAFPGTPASFFYLEPDNKEAFIRIHETVRDGVKFEYEPGDGHYIPHCTIGKVAESQLADIRNEEVPQGPVELKRLSLIQFNPKTGGVDYLSSWDLK